MVAHVCNPYTQESEAAGLLPDLSMQDFLRSKLTVFLFNDNILGDVSPYASSSFLEECLFYLFYWFY